MKTLEQVLRRNDYKRLSDDLNERVSKIAENIMCKMQQLDLKNLGDYEIVKIRPSGGGYYEYLGACNGYDNTIGSLMDTGFYYYSGDFCCGVKGASSDEKLTFLNSVPKLLLELDKIETEKASQIAAALKNSESLNI